MQDIITSRPRLPGFCSSEPGRGHGTRKRLQTYVLSGAFPDDADAKAGLALYFAGSGGWAVWYERLQEGTLDNG